MLASVYLALDGRFSTTRIVPRSTVFLSFSLRLRLPLSLSLPLPLSLFLLSRRHTHVALRLADSSTFLHTVISLKLGLKIHYSQVCTATRATDTRCASTGVRVFRAQGCCVRDFRGGRRRRGVARSSAEEEGRGRRKTDGQNGYVSHAVSL